MQSRRTRALIGGATALGIGLFAALPSALPASAAPRVPTVAPRHLRALYDVGVHSDVTPAQAVAAAAASSTFTQYTATVRVGTKSYRYVIAGKNPAIRTSNPASTITTELVPLIIKFPGTGLSWNPARADNCDPGVSALSRTQHSPIFVPQSWTWGGRAIGTGQITDAYQRADFWKYARPGGINPGFGVKLALTTLSPVTINVPPADQAQGQTPCGNETLGLVNLGWLAAHIENVVIPSLKSKGVGTATLPIFLLLNVAEYIGNTNNCCVLGYHTAYNTPGGIQTYALSMYDNTSNFDGSLDITALSHEVGEWQNDPYGNNPTPPWGHTGQVPNCQANLEIGDPLSGRWFTDPLGGFTYHPQELAFFSWFYHQKPSLGVHGWYSDQGTFTAPAKKCT